MASKEAADAYSPWQLRWLQPALLQPGWPGIGQPWSWLADVREDESICTFPESISLWCNPYTRWPCCHWCQSLCCRQDEQTDNRFLLCCNCHAGTLDIPTKSLSAWGSVNSNKENLSEAIYFKYRSGERRLQMKKETMICKQNTKYLKNSYLGYTNYNPISVNCLWARKSLCDTNLVKYRISKSVLLYLLITQGKIVTSERGNLANTPSTWRSKLTLPVPRHDDIMYLFLGCTEKRAQHPFTYIIAENV